MEILLGIVILIFSAILHEVMHGFVADKLGDPTARLSGRLTLNPLPHIDPVSSILLPAILIMSGSPIIFGAAKPVPVNPLYLKEGKKDLALVALAGPFTNIILAVVCALIYKTHLLSVIDGVFYSAVVLNLILAIVNLIPIPPLDGSKVFSMILPDKIAYQYLSIERYGIFLLFFLLLFPFGAFSLGSIINNMLALSLRLLGM